MLTAEKVRALFTYVPETGALIRNHYAWGGHPAGVTIGAPSTKGYLRAKVEGRSYFCHRLVWLHVYGEWPDREIDHKNRDKTDNRIENLRLATRSQNQSNLGLTKQNTTGVKGVTWNKAAGKYQSAIKANGRNYYLGLFDELSYAAEAYTLAALQHQGEFAGVSA